MIQRITPAMVGELTYRRAEGSITNNAKRMRGYDWFNAARASGMDMPSLHEMRQYGRECALAYILEGKPFNEAIQLGTRHMYQRAYDDARNVIRNFGDGNGKHHTEAVTSVVDTNSIWTEDYNEGSMRQQTAYKLYHYDDTAMFETLDWIRRMPLPDLDKTILTYYAAGYTTTETAKELGIGRTTLVMRVPKIRERIEQWLTESNSDWAKSWKMRTASAT